MLVRHWVGKSFLPSSALMQVALLFKLRFYKSHKDRAVLLLQLGLHKAFSAFLKAPTPPLPDVHWTPAQPTSVTNLVEPSWSSKHSWLAEETANHATAEDKCWCGKLLVRAPRSTWQPWEPAGCLGDTGNTSGLVVQPCKRHSLIS